MGPEQVGYCFSTMNVPSISVKALKKRERKNRIDDREKAADTCKQGIDEEIRINRTSTEEIHENLTSYMQPSTCTVVNSPENDGDIERLLSVSFDGAWQKRGSGKCYNSKTGHATMIGENTGKCVDFENQQIAGSAFLQVKENHGLSPGKVTITNTITIDEKAKRDAENKKLPAMKRKKSDSFVNTLTKETNEGITYQSQVTMEPDGDHADIETIPDPRDLELPKQSSLIITRNFLFSFSTLKPLDLSSLAKDILKTTYNAHNALDDVKILKQLIEVDITKEQLIENSFEVNEIERQLQMFNAKKHLLVSYNGVIRKR
ncbi:unnamed protein product [Mytilus edulis]|uniref:Mutator-like transposase domain-containing protein n=1 Tax=Mytilus edulis TaxID=6550 RepID=A0A8S3TPK7_MYTED|nr:unnamed protein product [Mytilus edulis]